MNKWTLLTAALSLTTSTLLFAADAAKAKDTRLFEMRTYYAAPGKLDDLHARFRDHTTKLFEKHGMQNIGYWVPIENTDNKLVYLLAYPSKEARDASWKGFGADPDWKAAQKASETNGRLVSKVETLFLSATDYSPAIRVGDAHKARVFELRTYTAAEGKLDALNARFRDHTVALFSKHGMANLGYWTPNAGQKGAGNTLIYLLSHDSRDAAKNSFAAFAKDPAWVAAKSASEKEGPLTVKDGVKSEFLKATDYSAIK